jgi:hypothetical protein
VKGHPILGGISGFLFGVFLYFSLWLFGAIPLHSDLGLILPIVGIVLGLLMAWWAPFGGGSTEPPPAVATPPAESTD